MHIGDQMKTIFSLLDVDRSLARRDVGGRLTDRDVSAVSMGGGGHAGGGVRAIIISGARPPGSLLGAINQGIPSKGG